jgi:tryptophan-rich sensory protein
MGMRLMIVLGLAPVALWNLFTIYYGVADYFDLPLKPEINPEQFVFGLVVTLLVFGFVIATQLIWNLKQAELPTLLLKGAWAVCVAVNLITCWEGTKRYIFYGDDNDPGKGVGLAVVTALIVSSSILLSKIAFSADMRTKPVSGA